MSGALFVWLAARGELASVLAVRTSPRAFFGGIVVCLVALMLQLWAILGVEVGVVEAVKRATGTVLVLGIGSAVFAERITARRVLAALVHDSRVGRSYPNSLSCSATMTPAVSTRT